MNKKFASLIGIKLILLSLCIYATTSYSVNPKQNEISDTFSNMKYIYFTNISLYLTIIASLISFGALFTKHLEIVARELVTLVLTTNSITVTVFWTLYFTSPGLIINKRHLEPGCETYILTELSLHLFPFILSVGELLTIRLKKTKLHYLGFLGCVIAYGVFIHITAHFKDGKFPYGFLNKMSLINRIMFLAGMYGCCLVFYNLFMLISGYVHKEDDIEESDLAHRLDSAANKAMDINKSNTYIKA